jgi:quercetin dioxygenase-like cupin family protein
VPNDEVIPLHGEEKKEAFHKAAEARIKSFAFERPPQELEAGRKFLCKLVGTDSSRVSIQVLNQGGENNLHYHPNVDLTYMVLKGKVAFYGPGDALIGEYGPLEGLNLPENSRYWFVAVGTDEAHLLQIQAYPKGREMAKRVDAEAKKDSQRKGVRFG